MLFLARIPLAVVQLKAPSKGPGRDFLQSCWKVEEFCVRSPSWLFVPSAALVLWGRGREETPNYHWLKTHWLGSRLSPSLCPAVWKCSLWGASHIPLSGALCDIYGTV